MMTLITRYDEGCVSLTTVSGIFCLLGLACLSAFVTPAAR